MKSDRETTDKLRSRADEIQRWLEDEAPYTVADQRHLDEHTPERAYWHHGYLMALRDVLRLIETEPPKQIPDEPEIMD